MDGDLFSSANLLADASLLAFFHLECHCESNSYTARSVFRWTMRPLMGFLQCRAEQLQSQQTKRPLLLRIDEIKG